MLNIGISCRITEAINYFELRNSLSVDWIDFFNEINFIPILIPHGILNINNYLSKVRLDGVILSGGNNLNPKLYASNDILSSVYDIRDKNEFDIIKYCIKKDLPIIGICRGMFTINIFFNGGLTHNINNHVNVEHDVNISRFNNYFGDKKKVNSFHNHAIKPKDIAPNLDIFAITDDGYIEGIFNSEKSIYGIQWHPERKPIDIQTAAFFNDLFKKQIK